MKERNRGFVKHIINKYIWFYEQENGFLGMVIADSYKDAVDELRKTFPNIDERLDAKSGWISIFSMSEMNQDDSNVYKFLN